MNAQLTFEFPLDKDSTLERYEGDVGQRALALAPAAVWFSGASGSGKTHLLQALCHRCEQQGGRSLYLSPAADHSPAILKDLRAFDVLAIDGLDGILGNRPWELALYDLINHLSADGITWLLMASQQPLPEINFTLSDVASRCRSMQWLQTGQLQEHEKRRVLCRFADEVSLPLPTEVLDFLLQRSPREIGSLIKTLSVLADESLRLQRRLTIPFLKQVLNL